MVTMKKNVLITGGAGFIGVNSAQRFLEDGCRVTVYDNLSRQGSEKNLKWLESLANPRLKCVSASILDFDRLRHEMQGIDVVLHFAAQVAVTTSVTNPRSDFDNNALGSFNVLEAARLSGRQPFVLYTSTNKVYGGLEHVGVRKENGRYNYVGLPEGVSETEPLDFHSPYGCSKGAADQYVRDYARIYNLPTVVFRQSCIYGLHQFGNEDQGWVAHFVIAAAHGQPINIYGDGKQVRDLLYVEDLVDLYVSAVNHPDKVAGRIYNIGGGPRQTLSLLELVAMLENLTNQKITPTFGPWRPGDQRIYVSDIRAIARDLGWQPTTDTSVGVHKLLDWVKANPALFK
jgi:CDP-paratose 2-epimerase